MMTVIQLKGKIDMSISGLGSSTAAFTAVPAPSNDEPAAAAVVAPTPDETSPAAIVTLSENTIPDISQYSVYTGTVRSMPMSVAAAPQLFAEADTNHDNSLSLEEFTEQLKLVGVSTDAAAQLFDNLNKSKSDTLSIDDFVNGVVSTNAKGNQVFQDLYSFYTSDEAGKFSMDAFDSFMAQGANVADHYWALHPELQQR
jgi:hypothetical protein